MHVRICETNFWYKNIYGTIYQLNNSGVEIQLFFKNRYIIESITATFADILTQDYTNYMCFSVQTQNV